MGKFVIQAKSKGAGIVRTTRYTEELYEGLSRIAQRNNISFNSLVLQCCRYALSELAEGGDKGNAAGSADSSG